MIRKIRNNIIVLSFYLSVLIISIVFSCFIDTEKCRATPAVPDSLNAYYWKAFHNVMEMGDILFMTRYNLGYATIPTEPASDYFLMMLLDGSSVVVQRPLASDGYGNNIQTIYLSASQVSAIETTKRVTYPLFYMWGYNSYVIRIAGNPSIYSTLVPSDYTLLADDWINAANTTIGKQNVATAILNQAKILDQMNSTSYTQATSTGAIRLTTAGLAFWASRFTDVSSLPNIAVNTATYQTVDNYTFTGSYLTDLQNTIIPGGITDVKAAFTTLGDEIGIPYWQVIAFAVLCIPAFMIVAGTVYGISGNSKMAATIAAPVAFVICMLIPDAMLLILTGISCFIVVVVMWRFV